MRRRWLAWRIGRWMVCVRTGGQAAPLSSLAAPLVSFGDDRPRVIFKTDALAPWHWVSGYNRDGTLRLYVAENLVDEARSLWPDAAMATPVGTAI